MFCTKQRWALQRHRKETWLQSPRWYKDTGTDLLHVTLLLSEGKWRLSGPDHIGVKWIYGKLTQYFNSAVKSCRCCESMWWYKIRISQLFCWLFQQHIWLSQHIKLRHFSAISRIWLIRFKKIIFFSSDHQMRLYKNPWGKLKND